LKFKGFFVCSRRLNFAWHKASVRIFEPTMSGDCRPYTQNHFFASNIFKAVALFASVCHRKTSFFYRRNKIHPGVRKITFLV
jgi:hypothetical protein